MALSQDLMGLGISPLQAAHTASGGTGPVFAGTLPGTTSAFSTANRIGAFQFVITVSSGASTGGVCLPAVGGDTGCLIADDFIINNSQNTTCILIFASSGVSISTGGSNTSFTTLSPHTTMTLFPVTTTQWIGCKGS